MGCYDQQKVSIRARRFETRGKKIVLGVLLEKDHKRRTVLYTVYETWLLNDVRIINRTHGSNVSIVDPLVFNDFLRRESLQFFGKEFSAGHFGFPVGEWLVYPAKGESFKEQLTLDYSMGVGGLELDLFRGSPTPRISFKIPREFVGKKGIALVITDASERDLIYGRGCEACGQITLNIPDTELRTRLRVIEFPQESGYFPFVPELGLVRADTPAERAEREAQIRGTLRYYRDSIPSVEFLTLMREDYCFIGLPFLANKYHPTNPGIGVLSTRVDEFTHISLLIQIPEQDLGKFPNLTLFE